MTRGRRRYALAPYRDRVTAALDPEIHGLAGIQRRLAAGDDPLGGRVGCRMWSPDCYLRPGAVCVACAAEQGS